MAGEEPNELEGFSTPRALWEGRDWPGDGFWLSGFKSFQARADRRWPGDGHLTDEGLLPDQLTAPNWTQATFEALTRFTQAEFDAERTETTFVELVRRLNAAADYLDILDRLFRTHFVEAQTATILIAATTATVTTTYAVATGFPFVTLSPIGVANAELRATNFVTNANGTVSVDVAVSTPIGGANLEVDVHLHYPVARATAVTPSASV